MALHEIFDTTTRFADLGLDPDLQAGLDKRGFEHPTHIQSQLIPVILDGRDALGQAKTGTGKTAAFGLPILTMCDASVTAQALILAPTRELAMQIVTELKGFIGPNGPKVAAVVGGESFGKQISAIEGGATIIVGTPGRVMDLNHKRILPFENLRWAVLDEVDRMLDIGFRDDIRKILSKINSDHQTIFVSATIGGEIERLARQFMKKDVEKIVTVADALTVSRVKQHYISASRRDKRRMLVHLLTNEEPALTVIFCRMKVTVRELAKFLQTRNIEAFEIHGDLHQTKRNRIMKRLREGKLEVLVASDLAARGLDVEGITHVVNYDLPEDPEVYVHRIGRTARAGRSGEAWSFVEPEEGQRLTEIEKLTGVLIDEVRYDDFEHSEPARHRPSVDDAPAKVSRFAQKESAEQQAKADPSMFPGGVVPKGPPPKTLGSRLRSRRGR